MWMIIIGGPWHLNDWKPLHVAVHAARSRALGIWLCALGTDLGSGGIFQMQGGVANIPQTYYINILPDYSVDSVAASVYVLNEPQTQQRGVALGNGRAIHGKSRLNLPCELEVTGPHTPLPKALIKILCNSSVCNSIFYIKKTFVLLLKLGCWLITKKSFVSY